MGGALARGMAARLPKESYTIVAANPSEGKLQTLREEYPRIATFNDNRMCAEGADVVILAVKPWKMEEVTAGIRDIIDRKGKIVISVAAGISVVDLRKLTGATPAIYYAIPNTAAACGSGVTFVTGNGSDEHSDSLVKEIFDSVGHTEIVEERQMAGGMAVASCGIAFMMRFLRAMTEGGVELGLYPRQALLAAARTMRGAADLIEAGGRNPEEEVDRVTTPGGLTIRGLNAMEEAGLTGSIVKGLRACVK